MKALLWSEAIVREFVQQDAPYVEVRARSVQPVGEKSQANLLTCVLVESE